MPRASSGASLFSFCPPDWDKIGRDAKSSDRAWKSGKGRRTVKTINFDQHVREMRPRARRYQIEQRARQHHRPARRRPRDADARQGLLQLAFKRRAKWLADGRLKKLGPRHYRVRLDKEIHND